MKIKSLLAFLVLALINVTAFAQAVPAAPTDITILNIVTQAMQANAGAIQSQAMIWLSSFMGLQFVITNIGLLRNGTDIEAIFGKLIGSLMWFGFCIYVLNNGPAFLNAVGNEFLTKFAGNLPSPGNIMASTVLVVGALTAAAAAIGAFSSTVGMLLVYILIAIFLIGMYFAVKVFMLQLELALIVILSPLSFTFLGMNALKDQGLAPFKSLIALGYRIVLFGIVYSAFGQVANVCVAIASNFSVGSVMDVIQTAGQFANLIFTAIASYIMLGFLLFKSDSIAAQLANGSAGLGTGDVSAAAAAGGAAGAAAVAGGAALAQTGGKAAETMNSFMKTNGGSVSNASPVGSGGPAPMKSDTPKSMSSLGSSGSGAGGISTNDKGVPVSESANPVPKSSIPLGTSQPSNAGNASDAGIAGKESPLEQKLGQLVDSMNKPAAPASFSDKLKEAGGHVEKEKTQFGVSIQHQE